MDKRKSTSQIEREIQDALDGDATLFYPGGTGGGGSRRKQPGKPVVKAHARTYSGCRECTRLHSLEQHATHGGKVKSIAKKKMKTKTKTKATKKTAANKKKKSITKRKPSTSAGRVSHPSLPDPPVLDLVHAAVAPGGVPASGRYHGEKVFVAAIYDYLANDIKWSIDTFKRWLVNQNRDGNLVLARADLVGAMDRSLVNRSEIESYGAMFHFVLAGSVK